MLRMPQRVPRLKSDSKDAVSAGMAGGGLGTVYAGLVDMLPERHVKDVLIILSPIVTVGLSFLGFYIKQVYLDPFIREKTSFVLSRLIDDAKLQLQQVLADADSSPEVRKNIRENLEKLLERRAQLNVEEFEIIVSRTRHAEPS
jgi:hypothetical protein